MKREKSLYYIDTGQGDVAIVFLHYFGGSSNSWSKVIAGLSPLYRCIAIDLPGFGNSINPLKLSVSDCAKEVAFIIKSLALKRYVLAGHSMGGKIAMSLASMQPFGLASVVLIAPSPPTPEPMEANERKELSEAYGDRIALEAIINKITAQQFSNCDIENAVSDNLKASHAAWNWWIEHGSREDISAQMSTVRIPVLVVSGAEDTKFSTAFLHTEMSKYFPSATFEEIEGTGHLIPVEAPADLVNLISSYLRGGK